jgi:hypothetical protein
VGKREKKTRKVPKLNGSGGRKRKKGNDRDAKKNEDEKVEKVEYRRKKGRKNIEGRKEGRKEGIM